MNWNSNHNFWLQIQSVGGERELRVKDIESYLRVLGWAFGGGLECVCVWLVRLNAKNSSCTWYMTWNKYSSRWSWSTLHSMYISIDVWCLDKMRLTSTITRPSNPILCAIPFCRTAHFWHHPTIQRPYQMSLGSVTLVLIFIPCHFKGNCRLRVTSEREREMLTAR